MLWTFDHAESILAILSILALLGTGIWTLVTRINGVLESVEYLRKEMKPNGGSSLRDSVNRLEAGQAALAKQLKDHAALSVSERAAMTQRIDALAQKD